MSKNTNLSFLTDYITADITNGRIGINTPSPTYSFDVTGIARTSTSTYLATASGSVGIGNTTTPTATSGFDALILGKSTSSSTALVFTNGGSTVWGFSYASVSKITLSSYADLAFETGPSATERMRIASTGNVGIGTSSPQSRLQAVLTNGVTFIPTNTGSIGGSVAQRVHVQAIEPGFMLSTDTNAANTAQTGTQTYSFGLQLSTYGSGDWRSQIYFGSTPLSFVYSGDQGANTSEKMRISTNGSIGAPNGTNIYNASDVRLKQNISTIIYGLDTISALNPVKFNWVDGFEPSEDGKDMLGFIAQEMQNIIPEAVESFGGNSVTIGDTVIDNPLRVNEKFIIPVLVKAIQELKAEIETLKNK